MALLDQIADERRRVADLVDELGPDELDTPSLCGEWTVRDVAAHLLMPLVTPLPAFIVTMARSRFDFDRANVALTARLADRSAADLAQGLRDRARHPFHPPGLPHEAPLTDVVIHTQDITRPLGRDAEAPPDVVRTCLEFVTDGKGSRVIGRTAPSGCRLVATDTDWTWGEGPEVSGRSIDLLLALAGRRPGADALTGPGRDRL